VLDVINLPVPTRQECSLDNLPPELVEKVRCFLTENEIPSICILIKEEKFWVHVYAVTPTCVIKASNKIKNGILLTDEIDNESKCIFIFAIKVIEYKCGKRYRGIRLRREEGIWWKFDIFDIELLRKFGNEIFSIIKKSQLGI